ncbi:hypothetical protein P170DRAFT_56090 [Aspergillus steynii IBT 23096]|uniref:Uncharacterized protein n=1 Tax=Aspergillus steynii IBT 23096 TaxID=1392250 RepID=A0A2I2FSG0_9EURO|nr:uncharacterized protein P170DRAFT_56090 [Aspergillus steynii IBT 23096]PLB43559.1 hypothetical protein P170DRAFT_56090 [Aspergillus steynii IBT 23096]
MITQIYRPKMTTFALHFFSNLSACASLGSTPFTFYFILRIKIRSHFSIDDVKKKCRLVFREARLIGLSIIRSGSGSGSVYAIVVMRNMLSMPQVVAPLPFARGFPNASVYIRLCRSTM